MVIYLTHKNFQKQLKKEMTMKFILTGHLAGRTMEINTFKYVDGVLDWPGPVDKMGGLIAYMATFNAYPLGSDEYNAAIKRDKENANGSGKVLSGQERGAAGGLSANGTSPSASEGDGAVKSSANGQGSGALGGGAETGRVAPQSDDPKTLKVLDALKALSPDVNENWTEEGLPSVSAVENASGVPGVLRKDIDSALPGWNRVKALAAVAADL
jgi:hypothetical protein